MIAAVHLTQYTRRRAVIQGREPARARRWGQVSTENLEFSARMEHARRFWINRVPPDLTFKRMTV